MMNMSSLSAFPLSVGQASFSPVIELLFSSHVYAIPLHAQFPKIKVYWSITFPVAICYAFPKN
jgi:hypothetical protein